MIIHIKVKPNSPRDFLEKISETEYKAEIKSPPERSKANQKLINLLTKHVKNHQSQTGGMDMPHSVWFLSTPKTSRFSKS